jgi:hypothetical protein
MACFSDFIGVSLPVLFNKLQPVRCSHEQLEQLDEPQPAQEDPAPVDDDLNLCPAENPKEDIFLTSFFAPHAGHSGFSSL